MLSRISPAIELSTPQADASAVIDRFASDVTMYCDENLDNVLEQEAVWQDELDMVGAAATEEELREFLARAPNKNSDTVACLTEYLTGLDAVRLSMLTY